MRELDISICILNWNAKDFLLGCLESVFQNVQGKFEVIVVDNASEDDSLLQISRRFPDVHIIKCKQNRGYAVGNNVGIKVCRGRYILILNPDTIVKKNSIEKMIEFMGLHPQAGACGCRLVHPETGKVEISARSFPTFLPLLWNISYIDRLFPSSRIFNKYLSDYSRKASAQEVDWVTGASLMLRKKTLETVGGFDEHFFMYCEDVELCYRLKQAGWQVYYYPEAEIGHFRGQSSKLRQTFNQSPLSIWGAQQQTASMIYFYKKHFKTWMTSLLRVSIVFTSLYKALFWTLAGVVSGELSRKGGRAISYLAMIPTACKTSPWRDKDIK